MKYPSTALFIGRFQPFHLGHLDVVKQAIKENEHVIIAIGSSLSNFRPANPLTSGERIQIIKAALEEEKIDYKKYSIYPVPNIENYALWVRHIELYLPSFSKIYTGSVVVKKLFEEENKHLKNPYQIIEITKKQKISSTHVRTSMLQNKKWEKYVSKTVTILLKKWNIQYRLQQIQEVDK